MTTRFALYLGQRLLRGKGGTARYLRGAVLGIAVSLVPLVVVMEVSTGMIEGITARLLEVGTYHLQVPLPTDTATAAMVERAASISRIAGVAAAVPEREGTAMLVGKQGAAGVSIRFVAPAEFARDAGLHSYMSVKSGTADLAGGNSLLVSVALARWLGIAAGDEINVLTTWSDSLNGPPRITLLPVSGIYETGYQELDARLVYAPLVLADRLLSPRSSRAFIGVKVHDPFGGLDAVRAAIAGAAGATTRVATWREIEYVRLASFATTKALLLFIMALVVVVASVNVSSSILMIIIERREEIGILKSLGAEPRAMTLSFLLAGLSTGLAGTLIGIATGLLVAVNINAVIAGLEWTVNGAITLASLVRLSFVTSAPPLGSITLFNSAYYLKTIPVRIDAAEVATAAIAALVLSAAAAWLPAARAAQMRPLDVLRKV